MARQILCGVYCIRNRKNNKRYIGSSQDIYGRFRNHVNRLNRGVHSNNHLQNAWTKDGENCFVLEIVESCDKNDLSLREQYHIDSSGVLNPVIGYNIAPLANIPPMTEDTKRKIGLSNKGNKPWTTGRHLPESTKDKIRKAVLANGWMKGKTGKLHPFYGKHHSDVSKKKQRLAKLGKYNYNNCGKTVYQLLNGVVIAEYKSTQEAARHTSIQSTNIQSCARGKRKSAGGYNWEYICAPTD